MRAFLLCNLTGQWEVSVEVLMYDKATHLMWVRTAKHHGSIEYARYFDPQSRYNRTDFRVITVENVGDLNAKLTELRARHRAGETHGETSR